jgi:hypothetical protein
MTTVLITGNTYPVKDQIKALGGKWDKDAKGWRVPADKEAEAKALVANATSAPAQSRQSSGRRSFSKCQVCGVQASRYVRIYGSGECRDCYEERKMGY